MLLAAGDVGVGDVGVGDVGVGDVGVGDGVVPLSGCASEIASKLGSW